MFIELPVAPTPSAELAIELDPAFDEPQTLTAAEVPRTRGVVAGSRIRLRSARDATNWAMHTAVDGARSLELTFTRN